MATIKQLVEQRDGVSLHPNLSPEGLVEAWGKVSSATKAIIAAVVPGLAEALSALETAISAVTTARNTYIQAKQAYEQAVETKNTVQNTIVAAAGTLTGTPIGPQQAAEETAKATQTLQQVAQDQKIGAMSSALSGIKDTIMNTEIPEL